jgi:hypothetical protein
MVLVKINVIGTESFKTSFDSVHYVFAGTATLDTTAVSATLSAKFGRQHNVFAPIAQRFSHHRFSCARRVAVNVGNVKHIDAFINSYVDDVVRLLLVAHTPKHHAAEPDNGYFQIGFSELFIFHDFFLVVPYSVGSANDALHCGQFPTVFKRHALDYQDFVRSSGGDRGVATGRSI